MLFQSSHQGYEYLRKKWIGKHKVIHDDFWRKHKDLARQVALGGMGSLMVLNLPGSAFNPPPLEPSENSDSITKSTDTNVALANSLKDKVPEEVRSLTPEEEALITQTITEKTGVVVKGELEGIRLNKSYGLIGGEQHLYRYPGDTVFKHADNASDWAMFGGAGIAPGKGAWGYFAQSEASMTELDEDRERYYIAVQTFLAPGFAENVGRYRDFFKYRKMLVVNPKTGQSVVTDIGDAGPAAFTGKSLGGSPEVMHYLGLASGPRKGAVLYFFIDDKNDQIPLGPLKIKE